MRKLRKKKPVIASENKQSAFFPAAQTKLAMGSKDDVFEKEADATADRIVNKTSEGNSIQKMSGKDEQIQEKSMASEISSIQKMETPKEEEPVQKMESPKEEEPVQQKGEPEEEPKIQKAEEEEPMQAKEEEEPMQSKEEEEKVQAKEEEEKVQAKAEETEEKQEEEETVQAKAKGPNQVSKKTEATLKSKKSSGSKMDPQTLKSMEQGFGVDLSNVNIHTGAEAQQMSQDIGAQAFTHGNDVYFNEGKYDPNSKEGKHLLAHELTHTIQQGKNNQQIQREPKPETNNNSWIDKMKELKGAAHKREMTDDQESEFIVGINEAIRGLTVFGMEVPEVKKMPTGDDFQPKEIYFDKDKKFTGLNPGVTKAGTFQFGKLMLGFIPNGTQAEAVVFISPNIINETKAYTQSVIEHEGVHVYQTYKNTRSSEGNDEVMAYARQFSRIFQFSDQEMSDHLKLWSSQYATAERGPKTWAIDLIRGYLSKNYEAEAAQNIEAKIDTVILELTAGKSPRNPEAIVGLNAVKGILTSLKTPVE